jgi:hypothetical protein
MPTPTDLVTDLPADFEVFGQAVDSDFADLLGGTTGQVLSKTSNTDLDFTWVAANPGDITGVTAGTGISGGGTSGTVTVTNDMATTITASGDIVVGTGSGTYDNLPIGTTGQVLTADTTVSPYKVKWETPAGGGGYTLINTGGTAFSGITITISSIPATYKFLYLIVVDAYVATADYIEMRLNGDSGNNYRYTAIQNSNTVLSGYQGDPTNYLKVSTHIGTSTDDNKKTFGVATITNYTATTGVGVFSEFWAYDAGSSLTIASNLTGVHNNSAAVTSLTLRTGNGNSFSGGTAYLYGVN